MSDGDPHRRLDYFDYELPPERIAQEPIEPRDSARLLVDRIDGPGGIAGAGPLDRRVADLPDLVEDGDVVVVNETRVSPARLLLAKPTGGRVEVLLLEPLDARARPIAAAGGDRTGGPEPVGSSWSTAVPGERWEALVRGGRRVRPGTELVLDGAVAVVVGDDLGDGRREVMIVGDDLLARAGRIPLPPYIHAELADDERYQTVFARRPGSVAAPTAGLHLTSDLLDRLRGVGVEVVAVELRVGLGTFRPITAERIDDHRMHHETYRIDEEGWARIGAARRVVAVGTTVVRALESAAATGELAGSTGLFINRGFRWQVVDTLMTNFHVPRSSLLVLIDAFVGPRWRDLYTHALVGGYRFLSFGDAMLVDRRHPGSR